jgi:hypothetical protein
MEKQLGLITESMPNGASVAELADCGCFRPNQVGAASIIQGGEWGDAESQLPLPARSKADDTTSVGAERRRKSMRNSSGIGQASAWSMLSTIKSGPVSYGGMDGACAAKLARLDLLTASRVADEIKGAFSGRPVAELMVALAARLSSI